MQPQNVKSILFKNIPSIIFHNCASYLAEQGKHIYFFDPEPIHELPGGWNPDPECLKLMTFLSSTNSKHLLQLVNSMHSSVIIPTLVIIKNFEKYLSSNDVVLNAFICAALLDAMQTCSNRLKSTTFIFAAYCEEPTTFVETLEDLYFPSTALGFSNINEDEKTTYDKIVKLFNINNYE